MTADQPRRETAWSWLCGWFWVVVAVLVSGDRVDD